MNAFIRVADHAHFNIAIISTLCKNDIYNFVAISYLCNILSC